MPELAKWVNGHRYDGGRLSNEQRNLRAWYARLLKATDQPAFRKGEFLRLNQANIDNPRFGRLAGESASGHWLYAYLRHDAGSGQCFVVIANLHGKEPMTDVTLRLTPEALAALGVSQENNKLRFIDRLASGTALRLATTAQALRESGLCVPRLEPLTACYFEAVR
jgi:hypothetical protein